MNHIYRKQDFIPEILTLCGVKNESKNLHLKEMKMIEIKMIFSQLIEVGVKCWVRNIIFSFIKKNNQARPKL